MKAHTQRQLTSLLAWTISLAMLLQSITPGLFLITPIATAAPAEAPPAAAPQAPAAGSAAPTALDNPLTVIRAQSTFDAAGSMVVTYTVRNNLPPVLRPDLSAATTITDQVDALTGVDYAADPNFLRSVLLTNELTDPQTSLQTADPLPDASGSAFALNLGDIPPLGTATAVLTLTTPAAAADFAVLDAGALATGRHQGRQLSASSANIVLAPDGFAPFLACTIDANCQDRYILQKAAELNGDPAALFAFVRGLNFELYEGSLRGARGTLWSEAGNATDQASLLVALLRASGIPAAYRQGTLDTAGAQTLLAGMFPATPPLGGYIPAGADTADPVNDPALIAEAQPHAWVEAFLPGSGWTAYDPSFPAATAGDTFTTPSGDRLAELPDSVRHKVTLQLKAERYGAFPVGGSNIYTTYPLSATLNTVELIGEPVIFAHLVESKGLGGLAFASIEHTYVPYFIVGDQEILIEGEPMLDLLSNFPFGQDFLTAEWLILTTTAPSGSTVTYERELFDDIGYDIRTQGGLLDSLERGETARISEISSWATLFAPSEIPQIALEELVQPLLERTVTADALQQQALALGDPPYTVEQEELIRETILQSGLAGRLLQKYHLLQFTHISDLNHDNLAEATALLAYPETPRVFTVGWERNDIEQTDLVTFDLGVNNLRTLPYPGQTDLAQVIFLTTQGYTDMSIEAEIVRAIAVEPLISVGEVFQTAGDNGIPFESINSRNLDFLATMAISDEAKARITTAVQANPDLEVLVPREMVTLAGASEPTIGWLQIDTGTGKTIDVMENGQHMAATQYAYLGKFSKFAGSLIGAFAGGVFSIGVGFAAGALAAAPSGDPAAIKAAAAQSAAETFSKAKKATKKIGDGKGKKAGFAAAQAFMDAVLATWDPPLPEMLYNPPAVRPPTSDTAGATLPGSNTLGGSSVAINATTSMVATAGSVDLGWDAVAQNTFAFDSLIGTGELYQNGLLVGSGAFLAEPADQDRPAVLTTDGTSVAVNGTATGLAAFHSAPLADLAQAGQFENITLNLAPAGPTTLALAGSQVNLGGTIYEGNLELVVTSPVSVAGSGAAAAANFAPSAALALSGGGLMVADAAGSATVGGGSAPISNGFALGNASGSGSLAPLGAGDTFVFNGTADFFAVALSAGGSTTPADSATSFDVDLPTNYADSYTVTVSAPAGWDVSIDSAGLVTAQPAVGAAAGVYSILVSAQSQAYPDLFAAAVHVVTVTPVDGVAVDVALDPLITVPWGEPAAGAFTHLENDGRMQLPGAAFTVFMTNTSSIDRTFDVDVSGLPAGWSIFGSQAGSTTLQVDLAAGAAVELGLYVDPTGPALPPVGSSFPFDVTATAADNPAVTATDGAAFTVAATPFPFVEIDPAEFFTEPNTEIAFDVTVTNVGNAAGSFDLVPDTYVFEWEVGPLTSPVVLNPGESASQTVTATVGSGILGRGHAVSIGAVAPTLPYTPTGATFVFLMGPNSGPILSTANTLANSCQADGGQLADAVEALALAAAELEQWCGLTDCPTQLRDKVVDAAGIVTGRASLISLGLSGIAEINAAAATLSAASDNPAVEAALADLAAAVGTLEGEVCEISEHRVEATLSPYTNAVLAGGTANFTLDLTNNGSLETTYAVTVTLPDGVQSFNRTITPGATDSTPLSSTPAALGFFDVTAEVTAIAPDVVGEIGDVAYARLNAVDRYVQVTSVQATPGFVETGVSTTTLSVDVSNVANVVRPATARTQIRSDLGGLLFDQDVPLTILAGSPRSYELGVVNTSGWATGLYTITVELLDDTLALIPNGSGFGYLTVGQGLVATLAVEPEVVPPGTLSVTTILTTELKALTLTSLAEDPPAVSGPAAAAPAPAADAAGDGEVIRLLTPPIDPAESEQTEIQAENGAAEATAAVEETALEEPAGPLAPSATSIGGYTRYEANDAAISYSGTWTAVPTAWASSTETQRGEGIGNTASLTFTGEWVAIGFTTGNDGGFVEVAIDGGTPQTIDLYTNSPGHETVVFDGLTNGLHTVTIETLGTNNPESLNDRVNLDFIDTWDGTALPDETVEAENIRLFKSAGWSTRTDVPAATNGTYLLATADVRSMWFPFTGDSVSFDVIKRSNGDDAKLYVDGVFVDFLNLYHPTSITDTLSFNGFGPGVHLLQVQRYRGWNSFDTFSQPGTPPFEPAPAIGDYQRFEEDHPALLYNGVSFAEAPLSWTMIGSGAASSGHIARSLTLSDTASLTFDGTWVNVGFTTDRFSGRAEIFIDGISQGVVDTYSNENSTANFVFDGLTPGTHTITITVLASRNPEALANWVHLDYIDVWNGTLLPDEIVEAESDRVYDNGSWYTVTDPLASGGSYRETTLAQNSLWFPFTGDSVTLTTFDYFRTEKARVYVDGQFVAELDTLLEGSEITSTVSFEGFGPGVHILQIKQHRGWLAVDTLGQPGAAPFYTPPPIGDYHRFEEDDLIILYDGVSHNQANFNWDYSAVNQASGGFVADANQAGRTISMTVSGEWLNLGFFTDRFSGQAEVFINDATQGVIDLYSREASTASFVYDSLGPGPHDVRIEVLGTNNGRASGTVVNFDYIDVWNGTALPNETVEAQSGRMYASGDGSLVTGAAVPTNGDYWELNSGGSDNAGVWFPFTGDSVSFTTYKYFRTDDTRVYVDGKFVAMLELFDDGQVLETFSFDGFGPGAHILHLQRYRGWLTADTFAQPGTAPFYTDPIQTGVIRTEEDQPGILYNGFPYTQTFQSWNRNLIQVWETSDGQVIESSTGGDTISFNFEGTWVGIGFYTDRFGGQAEIAIDGLPVETVDLYTRYDNVDAVYFDNLSPGSHTVTITVLGTAHPNSSGTRVAFDYYDTWDGSPLADGLFEEDSERLFLSTDLNQIAQAGASGGAILRDGLGNNSSVWFPFSGDSVSVVLWGDSAGRFVDAAVDGVDVGELSRFAPSPRPITYTLAGFGPGPHVLELEALRAELAVDAFAQPGIGPVYQPLTPTGIIRYEEDNPALSYNGFTFNQMPQSWNWTTNINANQASGSGYVQSSSPGDAITLTVDTSWVGVGFLGRTNTGDAEIFIDGISQGVFTTTTASNNKSVAYYFDLPAGEHTITIKPLGSILFDFIDVWDGTELTDGWFDADPIETSGRYFLSYNWELSEGNIYAFDDDYMVYQLINTDPRLWFSLTGEAFSLLYMERDGSQMEVFVDGVSQGIYDLSTQAPGFDPEPATIHFTGLDDGPHVVHVDFLNTRIQFDAIEADPQVLGPYTPQFEWYDLAPGETVTETGYTGRGIISTIAAGDINNDGIVELIAPADNGFVYAYRGDGVDTGGGTPELWRIQGLFSEPALADLDDDGLAEIILLGEPGLYVLEDTGATKWFTDTDKYRSYDGDAFGGFAFGAPSIGNVDGDPEPEIVIATSRTGTTIGGTLAVFDPDGTVVWEQGGLTRFPAVPTLADIGGDGILDVISLDDEELTIYDVANNAVLWSYTFTETISAAVGDQSFGAPAVANIDAKQPGGDPEPEIIVNFEEWVYVFNHDGSVLWKYYTGDPNHYRPSHVAISDVDGDGELEIITAQAINAGFLVFNHYLFVLEADGTLKWSTLVADTTASASGVATHDLDGDGIWEVIWNGSQEGFLVIDGRTGDKLYNKPFTGSGTIIDYPTVADVDGDNHAEIVLGGTNGIFVIGFDNRWGPARPMWNAHDYRITNINDDWSVPSAEIPSWQVHNTYRTQTPLTDPTAVYKVAVTYTQGLDGVTVLPASASRPITVTPPLVTFNYDQPFFQPVLTTTFASELTNLLPGEVREVSSGTEISYTLPSGVNFLTLPPLFVSVPNIVGIDPPLQTAAAGTTVTYTVTLTNPAQITDTFSLALSGGLLPWATLPAAAEVPPGGSATVDLIVAVPAGTDPVDLPFFVTATTGGGGSQQIAGDLAVVRGVELALTAGMTTTVTTGMPVTFTLTVTNNEPAARTYDLTTSGLAVLAGLPPTATVPAGQSVPLLFTAAPAAGGPQPFEITAVAQENGAAAAAAASVTGVGSAAVNALIEPTTGAAGPGATAVYTATITNLGDAFDTFDLALDLPAGWSGELQNNEGPVTAVGLRANAFNSQTLRLLVSPDSGAPAGTAVFTLTAASQLQPAVTAVATATLEVLNQGVTVEILSGTSSSPSDGSASWQVRVTNTGSAADTFDLDAGGLLAGAASFSVDPLPLAPGASQTIELSASGYDYTLPGTYPLAATAVSQTDPRVSSEDGTLLTITGSEGVEVAILPAAQTVTDTLTATYMLVVTNTGSVTTIYDFSLSSLDLAGEFDLAAFAIPPRQTVLIPLEVSASTGGTFAFDADALSGLGTTAGSSASLTVGCTVPAAPAGVAIGIEGSGLLLNWNSPLTLFEVYRSTEAYSGYSLLGTTPNSLFQDQPPPALVGDPSVNYFYELRAQNVCGDFSVLSGRVGAFDFPLTVGD